MLTAASRRRIGSVAPEAAVEAIGERSQIRYENHGWKIYGYVILENHLHLIVQAENLIRELPRFKSYTARQLI